MKLLVAAALAALAMPAFAEDTPPPPPQEAPAPPPAPATPMGIVFAPPSPVVQPLADTATAAPDNSVPWCTKTVVEHCREKSTKEGARLSSTPRPPGK